MNNEEKVVKLNQEVNRGESARQVLSNPIYNEAWTLIEAEMLSQFRKTKFDQIKERDELWRKMQTMDRLRTYLEKVMTSGKLGRESLTLLERARKYI